ncbi:MAG: thiolase family protein [Crenarchaeota archaeon]|nr:thiolase family protein [Thermoproteota archaeon]
MSEVVIVGFVRTPIGKFGGAFRNVKPQHLAAICIRKLLERTGIDGKLIDEVIIGCALQGGFGQNIARQAALMAGLSPTVGAYVVNRVCSSGMQAIFEAYRQLKVGDASLIIAGGVESMSTCPLAIPHEARWGVKHCVIRKVEIIDLMVHDGLTDPFTMMLMGQEADKVAQMHGAKREDLDKIAYESHMRATRATEQKLYIDMEPVDETINGERVYLDHDEGIRPDTSLEKLAKLKPVFTPEGPHTAGNSSQISDGAAMLLLTTLDKARELGLRPVARVVAYAWTAVEPWRFVEAPIGAISKVLDKAGWSIGDVDVFEVNEAFAIVPYLVNKFLDIPFSKMNILGGAIALGHPLGATGARIVTTLIAALKHVGGRRGVAALCHGTGGATSIALELI